MPRRPAPALGWSAAIASAAAFGSSGPFARPLLESGWSSASLVAFRIGLAALVLAPAALLALRGNWAKLPRQAPWLLGYGLVACAAVQVAFFNAVQYVPVAIALLLEYLGVVWVVLWDWLRTRHRPGAATLVGMVAALAGLAWVINPFQAAALNPIGLGWGLLAGVGLAVYFVISAEHQGLPPVAFVGLGLGIGAIALTLVGLVGLVPWSASTAPVTLLGASVPWWLPAAVLAVVAAAAAYLLGFLGAQFLGPTTASFVGLTEILFAVGWAWWILSEAPTLDQLLGGLLLLAGIGAVQWVAHAQRTESADVLHPA